MVLIALNVSLIYWSLDSAFWCTQIFVIACSQELQSISFLNPGFDRPGVVILWFPNFLLVRIFLFLNFLAIPNPTIGQWFSIHHYLTSLSFVSEPHCFSFIPSQIGNLRHKKIGIWALESLAFSMYKLLWA